MKRELACVGLATVDTIVVVPHWPAPDGRMLVERPVRAGGGPAATAAVAAARLGRSVSMIGGVGDDPLGEHVRAGLAAEGVDAALLAAGTGPTSESVILVDATDGGRTILHAMGAQPGALGAAALAACRAAEWVHVDHAGWPLLTRAGLEEEGLLPERISVDGGNFVPGLELAGLGLYAPTSTALAQRYPGLPLGAAVARSIDEGALRVVVTMGGAGALAAHRAGAWRVGGPRVDVVSTLGAGDVFHGALLAALLEQRPLPEALRAANIAAGLSCRAVDGRSAIPGRDELDRALPGSPPVETIDLADLEEVDA